MGFPQLGNIDSQVYKTIMQKSGNSLRSSKAMPWIRVVSCLGNFLALESSKETETFAQKYGDTQRSGRLGVEYPGGNAQSKFIEYSSTDRGFRPSPLINSLSVTQGNEGLSKKTTFTIVCYSIGQCEEMLKYFLEPGNMVLVEWGENKWQSVSGNKAEINACAIAAYNNLKHIQEKRKRSKGLYDAVLGVITGGAMNYGDNESFEIQVELTSIGELPAYLQHHKGASIEDNKTQLDDTSDSFDESDVESTVKVGQRLFKQMYNDLPAHKRTKTIRAFIDDPHHTSSTNFINMDKEMREHLLESTKNGNTIEASADKEVEIISDMPLFTDKRFIRVALAFEILDTVEGVETKPTSPPKCPNLNSSNGNVVWYNTIIRAHTNMFSADSNYLYIPNKEAPSFDLLGALITEKNADGKVKPYKSALPPLTAAMRKSKKLTDVSDLHPKVYDDDGGGIPTAHFPARSALSFEDQANFDGTYLPLTANPGEWGYLRDLYINFDFFCDVLDKKGLVTKDVYYELLNGMSSACNLYWDFQIIPRGAIKAYAPPGNCSADLYYKHYLSKYSERNEGDEELQVVDAGFQGKSAAGLVGMAKFQSRGTKTPFLSAELNFDIPGAMKGMTIAQKLSNENKLNNPNPEQQEVSFKGLFVSTTKPDGSVNPAGVDSVSKVLNSLKSSIANTAKDGDKSTEDEPTKKQKRAAEADANEEQKKSNYEYFVGNSMIIPKEQDRTEKRDLTRGFMSWNLSNNVNLDEFIVVGAWNDSQLLKKIQLLNEGFLSGGEQGTIYPGEFQTNVPLLPIKFNFTIHGVSGIKVGDTFNITDLPTRYKDKVFQVVQVSHDIAQNIWTTKVEGQLRDLKTSENGYGE